MSMSKAVLVLSGCLLATVLDAAPPETTTIRGFADLNFELTDAQGSTSGFRIGEFDTYITGAVAEDASFLSEVTYKYNEEWVIGFERLWIRYSLSDYFRVSIGKFHTPLGYWNRTYHHGVLLYTSTDKPLLQRMLPIHTLGIHFSGKEVGPARIYYNVVVGNGIGATPVADNDDAKSLAINIHSKVMAGVDWGFSIYRDHISRGGRDESETPHLGHVNLLSEDVDLSILVASMAADKGAVELLWEFAVANVEGETSGTSTRSKAGYVVGSYAIDQFVPYIKLDYLKVNERDLFYEPGETTAFSRGIN